MQGRRQAGRHDQSRDPCVSTPSPSNPCSLCEAQQRSIGCVTWITHDGTASQTALANEVVVVVARGAVLIADSVPERGRGGDRGMRAHGLRRTPHTGKRYGSDPLCHLPRPAEHAPLCWPETQTC